MSNGYLEILKTRRNETEEAIRNVLEAGQKFQTRNGRVEQASLSTLQQRLAMLESEISMLEHSDYTDTEKFVYRGCY